MAQSVYQQGTAFPAPAIWGYLKVFLCSSRATYKVPMLVYCCIELFFLNFYFQQITYTIFLDAKR